MSAPAPLLSVVVPAYNSAAYLRRCLDSLATGDPRVEVIVVDDGSTDDTLRIAQRYAVDVGMRVIAQENGGHGGAVTTGIAAASGEYVRVVDSDDWVDAEALGTLLDALEVDPLVDVVITNYTYEKQGRRRRRTIRFRNSLRSGEVLGWRDVQPMRHGQYLMMHALTYRTAMLRASGLELPRHTSYVDNLFAFIPMMSVRSLRYVDVDLYKYCIGRPDQSVNETVMLRRIGDHLRVTQLMLAQVPDASALPEMQQRYLIHHARIVCGIAAVMLLKTDPAGGRAAASDFWRGIAATHPRAYPHVRRGMAARLLHLPGRAGRDVPLLAYRVARGLVGFN